MAQRQFRSDDTDKWKEAFGTGSDGDLSYGGGGLGGQAGFGLATFTGTAGNTYGVFSDVAYFNGSNGGRVGDIIIIHQSQGTGAGNWELNKIVSRVGSTLNLKYPLINTYSAGCQIQSCGMFKNLTLSGTTTPYISWNGTFGGIIFLIAKDTLTISGAVSANGAGYRGAPRHPVPPTDTPGTQGEGYSGYTGSTSINANGNGGGAGQWASGNKGTSGGGGGGNGTAGETAPTACQNGGSSPGGTGGNAVGSTDLITMDLGGGGGSGACNASGYGGAGGMGGGIVILISKAITVKAGISTNGTNGENGSVNGAGGGGGAGGSILFKCETATLGSDLATALGGAYGNGAGTETRGGAGGDGRIHIDYSKSYTGTTNPTIDARQDLTVKAMGGSGFFNFF